ncbi:MULTISPECIES: ribosomal protein S18-alanine N-acetyltransferase [Erysipelothrix]|uniref:ribosomal protein S18-alanine N-acetyltransferase n=1 Tax=Erysipelothrix TaxID=1647 RepID=UPI0013789CDE|nr:MULTISPECIES: ribosomal protein S18-alanine N-acetyltransferase [unclassified Erysipelothrix]MBK2402268.1 ribosomal-protein-alanine N-acetyltransferase [Erysipelothrix sp. strain 2 (EsS2-6-Brazil)]NBA01942.1 ribosomal protein S18-alanine N-acetyltransferase [Erysipelothrix rhusiopathiae]
MIRNATIDDVQAIIQIDQLTLASHWTEKQYLDELSNTNSVVDVIETNHSVIGFYSLRLIGDTCDILQIAIHPDYQSQGYGKKLMNHLCSISTNYKVKEIFLEVEENNTNALQFYLKFNFEMISIRQNYYGTNRNAIVMRKVL